MTGIENNTRIDRACKLAASIESKTQSYSNHVLAAYRVSKLCRLPAIIVQHATSEEQAELLFAKLDALIEQLPTHDNSNTQQMMDYLSDFNTMTHDVKTQLGVVHYAPRKSMAIGALIGAALSVPVVFMKPTLGETIMFTGLALGMIVGVGVHFIQIQRARQSGKYF